ncbi:hypothetical protein R1sor_025712 [Riccia sorocarpa]|uniref:AP2/ERF domain-containing protein n=1 Tax=Riccia sorocarpa TaxID=122646 RepID=A0ABD3GBF8_9MARC
MRRGGGPFNSLCVNKGVRQKKSGKWVAEFRRPGEKTRKWLGTFSSMEEAIKAYNQMSIQISGAPAYSPEYNSSMARPSYWLPSMASQHCYSTPSSRVQPSPCACTQMHTGFSTALQLQQPSQVPQAGVILVPENERLFSVPIDWLLSSDLTRHMSQSSAGITGTKIDFPKKDRASPDRTEVFPADKLKESNGDIKWVLDGRGRHETTLTVENWSEEVSMKGRTTWVEGATSTAKEGQISIPRANTPVDEVDRNLTKELNTGESEDDLSNLWIMEDEKWSSSEIENLLFSIIQSPDVTPTTVGAYNYFSNVALKGSTEISTSTNEQMNAAVPTEERSPPVVPDESVFHEDTPWSGDNELDRTSNFPVDSLLDDLSLTRKMEEEFTVRNSHR